MTHDFGYGSVAAHRHANGGGWVANSAKVSDTAYISKTAIVYDRAQVFGDALVYGDALVCDRARVCGNAQVYGDALVSGDARVCGYALVSKPSDLIAISGMAFPVTVTPQNAAIGCQIKSHEEWLKVTPTEACKLGLPKGAWETFAPIVRGAIASVRAAQEV